ETGDDEVGPGLGLAEELLAVDRGAARGYGVAPAVGKAQVPPATWSRRGTERVRARTDAEIVGAVPVSRVVPRFEAGACPAGDLVAAEAGRSEGVCGRGGHRTLPDVLD